MQMVQKQPCPLRFNANSNDTAIVLQYGFKPANVDLGQSSFLSLEDGGDVKLLAATEDGKDIAFKGTNLFGAANGSKQYEYVIEYDRELESFSILKVDFTASNMRPLLQQNSFTCVATPSSKEIDQSLKQLSKPRKKSTAKKPINMEAPFSVDHVSKTPNEGT